MPSDQKLVVGEPVDEEDLRENGHREEREVVDAPRIGSPKYGLAGKLFRSYRNHKKERRYADRNYVRWYVIGSGWPRPKFVKPEAKGAGTPEYDHGGETYLFPRSAGLPDRESGMFVFVHKDGEAEPLNLTAPSENAIKADVLKEYLDMGVTSSPPSFWDKYDIDGQTILYASIALVLILAVSARLLGGA